MALGAAFVVTTALNQLLVFGPLRRRLLRIRDNLGMATTGRSVGTVTEFEELIDSLGTLLHAGRVGDSTLRNDLLRLQAHNQQLVQAGVLGDRLNAALPYRETVEQMLVQVKSFLRADFIVLLRVDGGRFSIEGALGLGPRALDASCCPERTDCPLTGAVERDAPLRSNDHRCRLYPHTMTHQLALPLTIGDSETRVLLATATTAERFDVVWDEALLALRGHLQQSLSNARKYDSIRRQAVTDHLTGLYNRRYFISRAGEELERSLHQQAPLSVVMIDIDNFKRFNDVFGHATGDRVLQTVGTRLQESVRVTDTCARHGGEEFTLLLPSTPGENAVLLADRVRQTLGKTRYTGLGLPPEAAITISCGVATCPQDATSVERLLELADQALYRAKEEGRDRVCQHEPEAAVERGEAEPRRIGAPGVLPVEDARLWPAAEHTARRRLGVP